ncbi:MAG: N-glycosylase/DNA lyase [Candidatus Bilamarchaeaceae archaeon]
MMQLKKILQKLKRSAIAKIVKRRIRSFKNFRKKSEKEIFKELCFCILTANYNAKGAIRIQKKIDDGFILLTQKKLASALRKLGHRFPNTRAAYICENRKYLSCLKSIFNFNDGKSAREWLVKNIKGLGYKEASHFLRNIGFDDVAIIDFHIIDVLSRYKMIKKPTSKSLSKKTYYDIEKKLEELAKETNVPLSELDLYLWYLETDKIFK